jgi:hypothetical protein
MAYGLRYTITQALRDGTSLQARIYEKDYTLSVKTYDAINISLDSNASDDEPSACEYEPDAIVVFPCCNLKTPVMLPGTIRVPSSSNVQVL